MDGKVRVPAIVYVERPWRSLKYEEIYLNSYETLAGAPVIRFGRTPAVGRVAIIGEKEIL
jgi:hypothetical protein